VPLQGLGLSLDAIDAAGCLAAIAGDIAGMPMGYEMLHSEGRAGCRAASVSR